MVRVTAEEDDVVFMIDFTDEGRITFFGVDTMGEDGRVVGVV